MCGDQALMVGNNQTLIQMASIHVASLYDSFKLYDDEKYKTTPLLLMDCKMHQKHPVNIHIWALTQITST